LGTADKNTRDSVWAPAWPVPQASRVRYPDMWFTDRRGECPGARALLTPRGHRPSDGTV